MSRVARFQEAIRAIEARGERPTSRSVLREIGGYHNMVSNGFNRPVDNGMNGRDLRLFAEAMESQGYVRMDVGATTRWAKRP